MSTVWILTIDHRHGRDISVNETEEGALAACAEYGRQWWSELVGRNDDVELPEEPPTDNVEAIKLYFDTVGDEYYELEQAAVGP